MLVLQRIAPPILPDLHRELDRVFVDVFGRGARRCNYVARLTPAVNLWADAERLVAEVEVPGLNMDDLEITVRGDELTIKGQRKPAARDGLEYHLSERGTGQFVRLLTLPAEVDADRVEATLRDGVLTIVLPKAAAAKARKIAVQAAWRRSAAPRAGGT